MCTSAPFPCYNQGMETTNTNRLSHTTTEYLGNSLGCLIKFEAGGDSAAATHILERYLYGDYKQLTKKIIGIAQFLPTDDAIAEAEEILGKWLPARIDVILKALDYLEVC
jgi:hypothetical protein